MNIYFYNAFHNGDCFISKGWVEDIIKHIPEAKFHYAHKNNKNILKDINAEYVDMKLNPVFEQFNWEPMLKLQNDDILIQTWCGTFISEKYNYIVPKYGHSTFIRQHNIYKKQCEFLYNMTGINITPSDNPKDYISSIKYNFYNISPVDNFIKEIVKDKKIVLLCNNDVNSFQSDLGDMKNVIRYLCTFYKDIIFVSTKKLDLKINNLYYTNDIFNNQFDLNEIGYLSKFCKLIVGKNSGAYIFVQHKENLEDSNKIFYNFSHNKEDNLPNGLEFPATINHSCEHEDYSVSQILRECIETHVL